MSSVARFIESGILDMYVLGVASPEEISEVENMAMVHGEVRKEIEELRKTLELLSSTGAVPPSPTVKPFLMATLDYMERRRNGEPESFPPMLSEDSHIDHYSEWLNRADMRLTEDLKDFHAKIIGHSPKATTAIVWIKEGAPIEVHDHELERFLVVEGACIIRIEKELHLLFRGDYLAIPLHVGHSVEVISSTPCKVILQREAV